MATYIKFDGTLVEFVYDELNREIERFVAGDSTTETFTMYDLAGQRLAFTDQWGVSTFGYDERGRLERVVV